MANIWYLAVDNTFSVGKAQKAALAAMEVNCDQCREVNGIGIRCAYFVPQVVFTRSSEL